MPKDANPKPPRLLDRVRDAVRRKHYSYRTEQTYLHWIRRYIWFHDRRHPAEMGAAEVTAFLTHLAREREVAAATQNQALSALLFLYGEVLETADRHAVFKQCLKETADRHGVSATFMAKPHTERAGSSCHIHLSLWRDDRNAFAGDLDLGVGPARGSQELCWFLAGCLRWVPELIVLLAPTVNSYKRFVDGSWAPTRVAWSYDNRTAGFRVVGHGSSLRIECRLPGADANPYIAYAAAIAAGLDGIENKIEPPEIFQGDIYAAHDLPRVPGTLREAIDEFERSDLAASAFGEDVVEHYLHFLKTEQRKFDEVVTSWERARYFERA